ncbi:unnamed protein product [Mucor hiemalis]
MLRQSIPPLQPFDNFTATKSNNNNVNRAVLLDLIQENHLLYSMEARDRPNNMIRILVELHRLGASQEQLSLAYQKARLDLEPIRISTKINQTNWEEYLGTTSLYIDYLIFFDEQLSLLGLKETLNKYFYSIPTSIGAQLQPLVQLAFGIEHDLFHVVTQALAYYASSYLDVSSILSYCQTYTTPTSITTTNNTVADIILFDLIRSDQRFDGKIEGNNTFHSSVKLLLKSKSDLIKTYMTAWSSATTCLDLNQRLDALIHTATLLSSSSSRNMDLDWFLAGGQLIDSALAIKKLIRTEDDADLVHLLFLSTLCTFVVQGRPVISTTSSTTEMNWEACIHTVIESSDPKSILALASIHKAAALRIDEPSLYLSVANTLAQFILQDGTWVKGGVGWIH